MFSTLMAHPLPKFTANVGLSSSTENTDMSLVNSITMRLLQVEISVIPRLTTSHETPSHSAVRPQNLTVQILAKISPNH
jgi:hypothetical protein